MEEGASSKFLEQVDQTPGRPPLDSYCTNPVSVSAPASDLANTVANAAPGTCFKLQPGEYYFRDVVPKDNMTFLGADRGSTVVIGSGDAENAFHGTPRNPAAPDRLPGGSSSGSAVAVAAREADLALGTDTGGSVRVPASFCGVHAMRPTHGRISLAGVLPFAGSYDTVGWFARDATLLRTAGQVLLGPQGQAGAKPLRLCLAEDALALAEPTVAQALRAWAQANGVTEKRQAFVRPWREVQEAYSVLQGLEIRAALGPWIRERRPTFGPAIAPRFAGALALDPTLEAPWRRWREAMKRELVAKLGPDEAWLLPAAPGVALPLDASGEQRGAFYERALALGALAGHAGLP
ncbi:MAG: amidase family protein, partial [Hylemonella sp.]